MDSRVAVNPDSICDLFAQNFSSVFNYAALDVPSFDFNWTFRVPNYITTPTDVQCKLEILDPKMGAGPDEIPPVILKLCATVLAPHVAVLFNSLLSSGISPVTFNSGFLVPIFKSGDASNNRNYRPIVIQSAIAKVFEFIIFDHLYFHHRKCISSQQHGLLRCCSSISNSLGHIPYTPCRSLQTLARLIASTVTCLRTLLEPSKLHLLLSLRVIVLAVTSLNGWVVT